MSASNQTVLAAKRSFTCRNIKKDFTQFKATEGITPEFHLELTKEQETVIVEDRPTDWLELANKDVNNVGLAYVLDVIQNQGLDVRKVCAFKDDEALDSSKIDPMSTHNYRDALQGQKSAMAELEATAAKMGVTVDSLIKAALSNKVEDLVKLQTTEGGSNNE